MTKDEDKPDADSEWDSVLLHYLDDMLHETVAESDSSQTSPLASAKNAPENVSDLTHARKKLLNDSKEPTNTTAPNTTAPNNASARLLMLKEKPYKTVQSSVLLSDALFRSPEIPELPKTPEPARIDKPVAPKQTPPDLLRVEAADQPPKVEVTPDSSQTIITTDYQRPQWAQGRFECLLFNVAGLRLAVPLVSLGSIHKIDRKFNALPGQYDWFIGILRTTGSGNIKVLDTALCVMPERYEPTSRETLEYVISIHGYAWGLACHHVEQSITLEPEQVKWRSQRGKRPWLAGTVLEHMCSLIDTDGFQGIILKAEQQVQQP